MLPNDPNLPAPAPSNINLGQLLRTSVGLFLLALGLGVAAWVIYQINLLLTNPAAFTLFLDLRSSLSEIEFEVVPREVFLFALPMILLSTVASIASTLIGNATTLLSGDILNLKTTLTTKLDELTQQTERQFKQLENKINEKLKP